MAGSKRAAGAAKSTQRAAGSPVRRALVLDGLRTVLDSLDSPAVIVDAVGVIVAANRSWAGEEAGVAYLSTCDAANPADAMAIVEGIRAVIAGERTRFERRYVRAGSGEETTAHVSLVAGLTTGGDTDGLGALVVHGRAEPAADSDQGHMR